MMTITMLKTADTNTWATIEVTITSTIDGGNKTTAYSLDEVMVINKGQSIVMQTNNKTHLPKGYTCEMATEAAMLLASKHCEFGYAVV